MKSMSESEIRKKADLMVIFLLAFFAQHKSPHRGPDRKAAVGHALDAVPLPFVFPATYQKNLSLESRGAGVGKGREEGPEGCR